MAERMVEDRIIPGNSGSGRKASPSKPGNDMAVGPSGGGDASMSAREAEFRRSGSPSAVNNPTGGGDQRAQ